MAAATSTALALPENRAVSEWDELKGMEFMPDGTEEVRFIFPNISLVQNTSQFPGAKQHIGWFYHSDREGDEAYTRELEGVGLFMTYTQALFEEDGMRPACSSLDGRVPQPLQPLWLSQDSQWRPKGSAKRVELPHMLQPPSCDLCQLGQFMGDQAPPCQRSIILSFWRADDQTVANFRVSGTGLKPVQDFVGSTLRPKNLPLSAAALRFYAGEKSKGTKNWQQLIVEARPQPRAEIQKFEAFKAEIRSQVLRSVEQVVEQDEPRDVTPGNSNQWNDDGSNLGTPPSSNFED